MMYMSNLERETGFSISTDATGQRTTRTPHEGATPLTLNLLNFQKGAEAFYQISDQMPVSYILTLLWVANNPDGSQTELEKYLGSSNATTSRAVKYWSRWKSERQARQAGADYIDIYQDPSDRRYNRLRLTKTGQMFINNLRENVGLWQGRTEMGGKAT